jgi:hypothetical protein
MGINKNHRKRQTIPQKPSEKSAPRKQPAKCRNQKKQNPIQTYPKLEDLAGIDAQYGTPQEIKEELEKIRQEY